MTVGGTLPKFTYTSTGLVNGDSLATEPKLACTADGSVAGTYSIVPSGADAGSNYEITYVNGTLTIYSRSSGGGSSSSGSSYTVSVPSAKNGDVTVPPKNASKGDRPIVTVKPDSGYEIGSVTVLDSKGNELKLTDKGNGKYTFTMPAGKVEVKATFMEDNSMLNFFYDVPNGASFYEAVKWAVENGITTGTTTSTFSPNATCTRAQSVTFLYRALGTAPTTVNGFTDVAADAFYADAVAWAVESGVTNGTTDSTFSPNNSCTRAQIVTFLYRAYQGK